MEVLYLDGSSLTEEEVWQVAYENRPVEMAPEAFARLAEGRRIMTGLAGGGKAIYGFNRGGKWPISFAAMLAGGFLVSLALWLA